MNIIRREPVALAAAAEALLVVLIAFGVDITAEQLAAMVAFATIVTGLFVRSQVSPVAPVVDAEHQ